MNRPLSPDLELSIVLPLGALAQQLMKVEAQLRLVNMKALDAASDGNYRDCAAVVNAKLEHICEALDSIKALVADISRRKPQPERDD